MLGCYRWARAVLVPWCLVEDVCGRLPLPVTDARVRTYGGIAANLTGMACWQQLHGEVWDTSRRVLAPGAACPCSSEGLCMAGEVVIGSMVQPGLVAGHARSTPSSL